MYMGKFELLTKCCYIVEVDECMVFDGIVIELLIFESVDKVVKFLFVVGVEFIVVCLLYVYVNLVHEETVVVRVQELVFEFSVSLFFKVLVKICEYECISMIVVNVYVKFIVRCYLMELEDLFWVVGVVLDFFIMQLNGGLVLMDLVKEYFVCIVELGLVVGVLMCGIVGCEEGFDYVLMFDMGGIMVKMGVIDDGEFVIMIEFEVGVIYYCKFSGLFFNIVVVELLEIGVGGGSIVCIDMGLIEVGLESVGADFGFICYGMGGIWFIVIDVNLVMGYLNLDYFNGGVMRIDVVVVVKGIEIIVGDLFGLFVGEVVWGIHVVVNSNMEWVMWVILVECGCDF